MLKVVLLESPANSLRSNTDFKTKVAIKRLQRMLEKIDSSPKGLVSQEIRGLV